MIDFGKCCRCQADLPEGRKSRRCTSCNRRAEKKTRTRTGAAAWKAHKAKAARADYVKHAEKRRLMRRLARAKLRAELIAAYGGECACCGEDEPAFLTLEHKNRDGKAHRQALSGGRNNSWSESVYRDLKKRGWPKDGYELLCFNCNHASWKLGVCPHRSRR